MNLAFPNPRRIRRFKNTPLEKMSGIRLRMGRKIYLLGFFVSARYCIIDFGLNEM